MTVKKKSDKWKAQQFTLWPIICWFRWTEKRRVDPHVALCLLFCSDASWLLTHAAGISLWLHRRMSQRRWRPTRKHLWILEIFWDDKVELSHSPNPSTSERNKPQWQVHNNEEGWDQSEVVVDSNPKQINTKKSCSNNCCRQNLSVDYFSGSYNNRVLKFQLFFFFLLFWSVLPNPSSVNQANVTLWENYGCKDVWSVKTTDFKDVDFILFLIAWRPTRAHCAY